MIIPYNMTEIDESVLELEVVFDEVLVRVAVRRARRHRVHGDGQRVTQPLLEEEDEEDEEDEEEEQ